MGAALWDGRDWRYLFGDRFLAGNSILSIAANDEAVVILSTEGIAQLRWRRMTLSGKPQSMRSQHPELARPEKRCLDPLAAVSRSRVPAWGSLELPCRDGENAQKAGKKWARYGLKRVRESECTWLARRAKRCGFGRDVPFGSGQTPGVGAQTKLESCRA